MAFGWPSKTGDSRLHRHRRFAPRDHGCALRWFITSDASRGQGIGSQLLTAALEFCAARGYRQVHLWTFEGLLAARHLYEKHGFNLAQSQPGSQWGKEVTEQLFIKKIGL